MNTTRPPFMFWAIAGVGLIWNLLGCWNYILQTDPNAVAQMSEVYQLVIGNRPAWATAGFAVSVFCGAVGCILLLLRRHVALALFVLSLLGSLAIFYFSYRVLGFDPATVSALAMSTALLGFAYVSARRGWLR